MIKNQGYIEGPSRYEKVIAIELYQKFAQHKALKLFNAKHIMAKITLSDLTTWVVEFDGEGFNVNPWNSENDVLSTQICQTQPRQRLLLILIEEYAADARNSKWYNLFFYNCYDFLANFFQRINQRKLAAIVIQRK